MNKLYYPINWENYPSEATPINESNLNKIDSGLNNLDNRVIEQDSLKLSKTDASNDIVNWTMDEETGVITITRRSGEQILFDLNIEKIPVSFSLSDDGILTMVTDDGTTFTANIGAMIPILTFSDSDEIAVTATGTGINKTYSFSVKDNSIKENKLQPNFLADIKVQSANASASASASASSANDSSTYATQSKSYAVGGTGTRTGEDTDNAKYYNEQAQKALSEMQKSQVTGVKGNEETEYRTGEVNITAENIGAVAVGGDVAENTVTYESNDVGPDGDPALWEIPKLTTGEKLSSIMQKVSRIANNFRYMIKLLGTTDISAIGDGTVTGVISTLNDNLDNYLPLSGGTITGYISGKGGGVFAYDGNVYLKCDGYDGWLSTIIHYKTDIGYPSISFVEKYSYSGQFFAENSKVIINGRFIYDGVFQAHNWYVIGYIQDGYRPGFQIHASAGVISNDSVNIGSALICIKEDGSINYYSEIPGFCIYTSITFKV